MSDAQYIKMSVKTCVLELYPIVTSDVLDLDAIVVLGNVAIIQNFPTCHQDQSRRC